MVWSWWRRVDKTDLVHQPMEKVKVIQESLVTSHQKSYTDVRIGALEFEVDVWVTVILTTKINSRLQYPSLMVDKV